MPLLTDPPLEVAPAVEDCHVVELRDYLLHPGARDTLVDLFDRRFVESQEALGMRVIGQFRDVDRPDRFVWLRGFTDMATRRRGLESFYAGPVWAAHRDAANATMVDSSDVHLLRPARPAWMMTTPPLPRPRVDTDGNADAETAAPASRFRLDLCMLRAPIAEKTRRWFEREALPALIDAGAAPCAVFETEPAPNDFPRLPVHRDVHVLAWLTRHADADAAERASQRLAVSPAWQDVVLPRLAAGLGGPMRLLRLAPTPRSLLR